MISIGKHGSLFSGIGGLDIALEEVGYETAWQVEQDEFCTNVLEKHWPDVKRYGAIEDVDWEAVELVDIISAGFPCQPWSHAGKRQGTADERWLWDEITRAIRVLRPRYVFLENVSGLISGHGLNILLSDLAKIGFDAAWTTQRASDVGAPHRRERVFLLANDRGQRIQRYGATPICGESVFSWCEDVRGIEDLRDRPNLPPSLIWGNGDGPDSWAHRLKALGNAVVPAQAALAYSILVQRLNE